jgi:hypothetical protein
MVATSSSGLPVPLSFTEAKRLIDFPSWKSAFILNVFPAVIALKG